MNSTVNLLSKTLVTYTVFIFIFLTGIFTRSFLGLNLFSFLLGELAIGFCFALSLYFLFYGRPKQFFNFKKTRFNIIHKSIIIYFLARILINFSDISLYNFKVSSYIWTIAFIYFGVIIASFSSNGLIPKSLMLSMPLFVYIFQTGNYPNFIISFFQNNSDKFQFMKASDMVIIVIASSFYIKQYSSKYTFGLFWGYFLFSLFLPLVAANSRGAVGGLVLFFILNIIFSFKELKKLRLKIILLIFVCIGIFSISSLRVSGVTFDTSSNQSNLSLVEELPAAVKKIADEKSTEDVFLSFYIQEGRIYSTDPTTNWRLDIWQDVFEDLKDKDRLIRGYGYGEIIPVMTDPSAPGRLGRDGLNENVHNYFVNTLARGGLINLALFIYLNIALIKLLRSSDLKNHAFTFMLPCLFMASVDIPMEGVQFPLIYYFFIGYYLSERTLKSDRRK
tara:strand:- start:1744 stop:3084 length:1341 start_codon:yes stop_codon:yes gene_type:complete